MLDRSSRGVALTWRKASRSLDKSDCVEVAALGPSVLVRDSRDSAPSVLALDPAQWSALVNAIQNGRLDGR
ncbi:DUF397 domain-containing protein [Actinomadura sp. 7K507]|uniref:DUF397 domain-containing protein n=1 Tax=Actinomadura sp. 7K507 TaxID=2530365 RepID=UPI001048B325|nr:DUF397 domain-containing protein [Actinomadura sp. 7K507]TDC88168.1 DUF397 domain-containing protein [Actinomadura sp. 7K507]